MASKAWLDERGPEKGLRAMLESSVAHHFLIGLTSPAAHLPRQPLLGVRNSCTPDLLTPTAQQIPSPCPQTRTFQIPKSQLTSWTLTPHLLRWRLPLRLAEDLPSTLMQLMAPNPRQLFQIVSFFLKPQPHPTYPLSHSEDSPRSSILGNDWPSKLSQQYSCSAHPDKPWCLCFQLLKKVGVAIIKQKYQTWWFLPRWRIGSWRTSVAT